MPTYDDIQIYICISISIDEKILNNYILVWSVLE